MKQRYDFAIIGSGPAGHHAAIEAAKAGCSVALIEKAQRLGGACVHRGTIPSKTLRAAAVHLSQSDTKLHEGTEVSSLMTRLTDVVDAHVGYMSREINEAAVTRIHGRARFVSPGELEVSRIRGPRMRIEATHFIVAVGSRPRKPPEIPIDHENILDSDSILSMIYLPQSLTVLGGGVIASEWASIFAALGVEVTMVDRAARPMGFMDEALTSRFVHAFESNAGCRYLSSRNVTSASFDGVSHVDVALEDGDVVRARKVLCALGRVANADKLGVEAAGITLTKRGHIAVDEHSRASENIYAVGDVIGFPALAATSMVQGRCAVRHALSLDPGQASATVPVGIFTIPEMASVGLTKTQAREKHPDFIVGSATFDKVARGHISGTPDGFLELIVSPDGSELLGAHIIGRGATELIHLAQLAMINRMPVSGFVDNAFNFPTLAEAYRIAALSVADQHANRHAHVSTSRATCA